MARKKKTRSTSKRKKISPIAKLREQMTELHSIERHLPLELRSQVDVTSLRTSSHISSYIKKMKKTLRDVNVVHVPRPAPGSLNKERPLSSLLKNQVEHFEQMENELPVHEKTAIAASFIRTEGEAAHYIKKMTAKLHGHRIIDLPKPAPGSANKHRPASTLLRAQVNQFRKISREAPVDGPLTEAEAAMYIKKMTSKMHKPKRSAKR
jgi:hypothetical protein